MSSVTFFGSKRGVSPLIATVLLIAFAVALGAVIMNWGRGFVQERTADVEKTTKIETGCALDVQLKVTEIDGTPQICYGGGGAAGQINFTLDNQGKKDIKELGLVVGGTSGIYQLANLNISTIIAGGAIFGNVTYDYTSYGRIKYVRFIPKIDISGVTTPCPGSALQKDSSELRNCTAT